MHLEEIHIYNYRSCKELSVSLSKDIPNIFIGLNDCGKTTVLQSLDLLLGERSKYSSKGEGNYKSDLSNTHLKTDEVNVILNKKELPEFHEEGSATLILGKLTYSEEEAAEILEQNLTPLLKWSFECSESNTLWYAKRFSSNGSQAYLLGLDAEPKLELWNLPATGLSKKIDEYNVSPEDIKNENGKGKFSNFEKIRAIYAKLKCVNQWIEFKSGKDDKAIFPSFSLFDWNTSLDEIASLANAIMKKEIDAQLAPLKVQATKAAEEADKIINEKFGEISEVIKEVAKGVESINSKVYFEVKEKISDIMVTKTNSDGQIHLENQGEGLKRQIWFSLIKAKASEDTKGPNQFIWAFDEPETHLYPGAQRDFFDILNKISKGNVQTLVSTHSTIFIDKSKIDKITSVSQNSNGYTEINKCSNVDGIYESLNVKNSDFLFYNKFLIVEGDTEQYLIPKLYEIYTGSTLLENNIQLINIQGKDKWTKNKTIIDGIMDGFKKSEDHLVFLFDNDMRFEIGQGAITENMHFVGDQDIEDSISSEIWVEILNEFYVDQMEFTLAEIDDCKSNVVKGVRCNANQKFYKLLTAFLRAKWIAQGESSDELIIIPSKGNESADFILKGIKTIDQIPDSIKAAFLQLNS
jgi:AAA15 family ATPase/GTPase